MLEYPGWQETADLIDRAYLVVIADNRVTTDFPRLMDAAETVCPSGFGDALIAKIDASSGRGGGGAPLPQATARRPATRC